MKQKIISALFLSGTMLVSNFSVSVSSGIQYAEMFLV